MDWTKAPFDASYTDFDIQACQVTAGKASSRHPCYAALYKQPYGDKANQTLTTKQWNDLSWIKKNWLTYDYCTDTKRWTVQPKECKVNWPNY